MRHLDILIGSVITGTITIASFIIIKNEMNKLSNDGMMCINGMMYTKVMGNLLIYPRPDEPMTCSIYSYIQKHRDKK